MTVDPPLVSLGKAEPAFQIKIVRREIRIASHEQAGLKAAHHFGHLLVDRIRLGDEPLFQFPKLLLPMSHIARFWLQRLGNGLDVGDIVAYGLLRFVDCFQTPIDALGQPRQLLLCAPPFFASRFRCKDCCTCPKASVMRKPGGCRGPP